MPKPSSIKTLPKSIFDEVNRLLTDEKFTLDDVVAKLQELGHPRSRSALGRHKKNIAEIGEKLKRSREAADALVRNLGEDAIDGKQGRLLTEILRTLMFDKLTPELGGGEDGEELDTKDFAFLAKALKELSQANRLDLDFEEKINEQVQLKAKKLIDAATAEAKGNGDKGLSPERLREMAAGFLGVKV